MKKEEKEFIKFLKGFSKDLNILVFTFKVWRTCLNQISNDQYQKFPNFWGTVLQALKDNFFISFSRIFEDGRKKKNLNIFTLLDFCEENISIFSRESLQKRKSEFPNCAKNADELKIKNIDNIREKLKNFSDKIGKIRNVRHTKIAHKSKEKVLETLKKSQNIGVKNGEAWEIICFAKKVEHFLSQLFHDGRKFDFENKTWVENYDKHAGEIKFFDEYDKQTIRFFDSITKLSESRCLNHDSHD